MGGVSMDPKAITPLYPPSPHLPVVLGVPYRPMGEGGPGGTSRYRRVGVSP